MTYDSPLWAFEGEEIIKFADFKEEGLVSPEEREGEKGILKIEPYLRARKASEECWPLH